MVFVLHFKCIDDFAREAVAREEVYSDKLKKKIGGGGDGGGPRRMTDRLLWISKMKHVLTRLSSEWAKVQKLYCMHVHIRYHGCPKN